MRSETLAKVALVLVAAGVPAAACGGDDGASGPTTSVSDPGPNPTGDDPGPNDTSGGPETVQGIVQFASDCIALQVDGGSLSLDFDGYSRTTDGGEDALRADDDGRVLAHEGDEMVVTGRTTDDTDACGTRFTVESLNYAGPAG